MRQKLRVFSFCLTAVWALLGASSWAQEPDSELGMPIAADDKTRYRFEILSQSGYMDERGRRVIDALENYRVYLALSVDTAEGRPVIGLAPNFDLEGSSVLIPPGQSSALTSTDESGILEFSVTAGTKGVDRLTVSYGANETTVYFNIISLAINDFPTLPKTDTGLSWSDLMKTELQFVDGKLEIHFAENIKPHDGKKVRVWAFMMPLEPDLEQRHFLLTSSPPHCFFDIPGGSAGVIEAFSEDGIEASWDPVLIEGRFELVSNSQTGIIYRLRDAEVVDE